MDYEKASEILKALGHPIRLKIVEGLLHDECNVTKVMSILRIPQSTTSQHLTKLKQLGIVVARKDGVRTCYRVTDKYARKIISALKD